MAGIDLLRGSAAMIKIVGKRLFCFGFLRFWIGRLKICTLVLALGTLWGNFLYLNLDGSPIGDPIVLTWNDNSSNEDGFRIERSTDNIEFVEIAIVGENVTSYTDASPLAVGQMYAYRVRAYNEFGNSGYTNTRTTYYDPSPQFFFGELGSDGGSFAIMCRADGSAIFVGTMESEGLTTIVQEFQLRNGGFFEFDVSDLGIFSGQIVDGQIYGAIDTSSMGSGSLTIASSDLLLSGSVSQPNGGTASVAGFYDTGIDPESGARLIVLAGPDGGGFVISSFGMELSGGKVDFSAEATNTVSLGDGTEVSVGFSQKGGVVSGTVVRDGESFDFLGQDEEIRNKSVFLNASIRSRIDGGGTVIAGFVISGVGEKRLLIRGVGPSLAELGVDSPAPDPQLKLFRFGESETLQENDDWWTENVPSLQELSSSVGAFPLSLSSKDAAFVVNASAGLYWVQMTNQSRNAGTGLVEIYDLDEGATNSSLVNLSLRGKVMSQGDPIIAGFVVSGRLPQGVMIRAMGQELQKLGVSSTLRDPVLRVYGSGSMEGLLAENNNWQNDADLLSEIAQDVGAFDFERGSRSAAKAMWLGEGLYTAVISDSLSNSGEVLVEFYEIP